MNLPQIRMTSSFGYIGLNTNNAKQEIQQPKADLQIQQTEAKMNIQQKDAQVKIDQTEAFAQTGNKTLSRLVQDNADRGKQAVMDFISKTASEGKQLMAIENGGNAIADIARSNTTEGRANINIKFIPSYGSVKINTDPGFLDINWELGGADIQAQPNKPIIDYSPGNVEVYMKQKNSLDIDFVGGIFDSKG